MTHDTEILPQASVLEMEALVSRWEEAAARWNASPSVPGAAFCGATFLTCASDLRRLLERTGSQS